ncbi:MAG: transglycosylase family protein [Actinomycetota bacterium]|nr:transglycosylase family protein [Actinomycetota bacterium]
MRTHRTMALAATLSIAAGAAVTDLPSAVPAHADVSYSTPKLSANDDGPSAEAILAALRQCESGGDYSSDNHDGFFGAYQFMVGTWRSLGYEGYPNEASPRTQDEAVVRLQAQSGWDQWPACSVKLGLTSLTLPPLAPAKEAEPRIAVVPLTTVAVLETDPPPPPADEPPRPRHFQDLVAEFG